MITNRYVHGASVDERLVHWQYDQSTGAETKEQFYHRDHQGSIVAMSNGSGARADGELYTYDAFGNQVTGATTGQPFRYTGRRYDAETGLYYYRARYYSSDLGRFLQTDPIGYEDNMNMYAYVGNDPLNNTDPSGRVRLNIVDAIKYPKSASIINSKVITSQAKFDAFGKITGASRAQVNQIFTPNAGPSLLAEPLGSDFGQFNVKTMNISINTSLLQAVEDGVPGAAEMLSRTVEHEVAHFLDISIDGVENFEGLGSANPTLLEDGDAFEIAVYGSVVYDYATLAPEEDEDEKKKEDEKDKTKNRERCIGSRIRHC